MCDKCVWVCVKLCLFVHCSVIDSSVHALPCQDYLARVISAVPRQTLSNELLQSLNQVQFTVSRLGEGMPEMIKKLEEKAQDMHLCMNLMLHEQPSVTSAKGKGKGIPKLGEPFGPLIVESGWAKGWKVWVGDLPRNVDKVDIGRLCPGQTDVSVNNFKSKSGMAFAVITFADLDLAMQAFETLLWTRFDHGGGQLHWPSVKWFGHDYKPKTGN
jgi:hypothetical protein